MSAPYFISIAATSTELLNTAKCKGVLDFSPNVLIDDRELSHKNLAENKSPFLIIENEKASYLIISHNKLLIQYLNRFIIVPSYTNILLVRTNM